MAIEQFDEKFGQDAAEQILKALSELTHGSVQIIVQDSKIVQIDKVEKVRLDKLRTEK